MGVKRKPFQGVLNIIRFNWHFYAFSFFSLVPLLLIKELYPGWLGSILMIIIIAVVLTTFLSLLTSYYIYDYSDLYEMQWLEVKQKDKVLNVHSGFDEASDILQDKLDGELLTICDFYDPKHHTEVSIKRARKLYPPSDKTIPIQTNKLPFTNDSFDISVVFLAAHEIRDDNERTCFFRELNRVTKKGGEIIVTEHLRDTNNFIAYNVGFMHFHSKSTWRRTYSNAGLKIWKELKTTPFVTTFILKNNGDTY